MNFIRHTTESSPVIGEYYDVQPGTGMGDGTVVSFGNLVFDASGELNYSDAKGLRTLEEAQARGMEFGSISSDPLFADPKNDDFTLPLDSPAKKIGFIPFDYKKAGPRDL